MSVWTTVRAPPPAPRTTAALGIFWLPTRASSAGRKPEDLRVVADELRAVLRDGVHGARALGLVREAVEHGHDALLVRHADAGAQVVFAAQGLDGLGEADRRRVDGLIGGIDACRHEGRPLECLGERVGNRVAE